MSLRDEIAEAMSGAWHDVLITEGPPRCYLKWLPAHFAPCADAVLALLREGGRFDEAAELGARALCYHRTQCDTYWDDRPETHDDWRQSARIVLLAALGEEGR